MYATLMVVEIILATEASLATRSAIATFFITEVSNPVVIVNCVHMPAKITVGSEALWTITALNGTLISFLVFGHAFPVVPND
jgi:hypothetical protein